MHPSSRRMWLTGGLLPPSLVQSAAVIPFGAFFWVSFTSKHRLTVRSEFVYPGPFFSHAACVDQVAQIPTGHIPVLYFVLSSHVRWVKRHCHGYLLIFLCLAFTSGFPPVFCSKALVCGWSGTRACIPDLSLWLNIGSSWPENPSSAWKGFHEDSSWLHLVISNASHRGDQKL